MGLLQNMHQISDSRQPLQVTIRATPMMKTKFAMLAILSMGNANASGELELPVEGWSLHGGAISHHFSSAGVPIHGQTKIDGFNDRSSVYFTYIEGFGGPFVALPGENSKTFCARVGSEIHARAASYGTAISSSQLGESQHDCVGHFATRDHSVPAYKWNEVNLGIGIEYERRFASTIQRFYAGIIVDSYYQPGAYAGAAIQSSIYTSGRIQIDLGGAAMMWWRSVPRNDASIGRRWVPALLPILSVEDLPSGIGAHITFIPGIRYKGTEYTVDTLAVQLKYRF